MHSKEELEKKECGDIHHIRLVYFKAHGKYYTEATVTVRCPSYNIPNTVAKMFADGNWPGLCDAPWHHFDVLICSTPEGEKQPADHPDYIVPSFLRNERIMDTAY